MHAVAARKARGAFFTPSEMASFISAWAVRTPADILLEPSCGEAAFLTPAVQRLMDLGATSAAAESQVHGAELHTPSASAACDSVLDATGANLTGRILVGDFFARRREVDFPPVDACIGNPPYVRYQAFSGDARRRAREAALAQGVAVDGLASSWAPFVAHAASFLKRDGRLGLVLPAELLSVNYAAPIRRYLLDRFASVRVVAFEERVFPGVLEEVVLLLAEGEGPCGQFDLVQVEGLHALEDMTTRGWIASPTGGKWTNLLLPAAVAEAIRDVEMKDSMVELGEFGTVSIGMVTGANDYFCLTDAHRRSAGLTETHLRKIMPPGSKHTPGVSFSASDWCDARDSGKRVWLFAPAHRKSVAAAAYITAGENGGHDRAYKCRVRRPWYAVPLVAPPQLFMVYMASEGPRFIENPAGLINVNSVHGIHLNDSGRRFAHILPVAALSTFTLLASELLGRTYGGGLLKLEPREAARVPVPAASILEKCEPRLVAIGDAVRQHLSARRFDRAVALVDQVVLREGLGVTRRTLDGLLLGRRHMYGRRLKRSQG